MTWQENTRRSSLDSIDIDDQVSSSINYDQISQIVLLPKRNPSWTNGPNDPLPVNINVNHYPDGNGGGTITTSKTYKSKTSTKSHCSNGTSKRSSRRSNRQATTLLRRYIRHNMKSIIAISSLILIVAICLPVLIVSDFDISLSGGSSNKKKKNRGRLLKKGMFSGSDNVVVEEDAEELFDIPQISEEEQAEDSESSTVELAQPEAIEPLEPYTFDNVLQTISYYHDTIAILVYDPQSDKFLFHYSNGMRWIPGCHKLITSFKILSNSLRTMFPQRFNSDQPEFSLSISSADYPGIKYWLYKDCIRSGSMNCAEEMNGDTLSPILSFGSVFRNQISFPTMISMPMPQLNHLSCFHYWISTGQVCDYYYERTEENPNGLVFPETLGLEFEELIPQVVWRGTDFSYLHKLYPELRTPNFDMDVGLVKSGDMNSLKLAATKAMREVYNELIPRWKGVVWTAEAERDAELRIMNRIKAREARRQEKKNLRRGLQEKGQTVEEVEDQQDQGQVPGSWWTQDEQQQQAKQMGEDGPPILPWCNIKFAGSMWNGEQIGGAKGGSQKTPTSEIPYYQEFEAFGIPAIGEGMSLETLGQYKYHIDIGGGGGTTWSGTLEKLGLPGLLFHHVTPTKDYLHDMLKPWVHYVPVKANLSDLKEKFEWAESHPAMAKRISDNATQFVKRLGTSQGMEEMANQFFNIPIQKVVDAYQPLEAGSDWREVMRITMEGTGGQKGGGNNGLRPIMECGGYQQNDCVGLVDDVTFSVNDVVKTTSR